MRGLISSWRKEEPGFSSFVLLRECAGKACSRLPVGFSPGEAERSGAESSKLTAAWAAARPHHPGFLEPCDSASLRAAQRLSATLSLPRPQYVTWVTMAQVGASPTSARPGWSDPGKHKYKPIAKLRTMREM
ncbi:uncharacterized protein LOC110318025 [Mus pahari]|nr:uncharacterized protein LOC110318025 [Mus pahari]